MPSHSTIPIDGHSGRHAAINKLKLCKASNTPEEYVQCRQSPRCTCAFGISDTHQQAKQTWQHALWLGMRKGGARKTDTCGLGREQEGLPPYAGRLRSFRDHGIDTAMCQDRQPRQQRAPQPLGEGLDALLPLPAFLYTSREDQVCWEAPQVAACR